MSLASEFNGLLPLVGGLSGLGVLTYFCIMIYYAHKKDKDMQRLEVRLACIEGILLGRKR